jgi:hypothetical protein
LGRITLRRGQCGMWTHCYATALKMGLYNRHW